MTKLATSNMQNTDTGEFYNEYDDALRRHRQMVAEFLAGKRGRW